MKRFIIWPKTPYDFEPSNFDLKNNNLKNSLLISVWRTNVIFVTASQIIHAYESKGKVKLFSQVIKPEKTKKSGKLKHF